MRRTILRTAAIALLALLAASAASAEGYRRPSQALADLVTAPPTPQPRLGPTEEWMLLVEFPGLPPIADLAEREVRLAGLRIRPRINGPSRSRYADGLRLVRVADGNERAISGLPAEPRIDNLAWSPGGERFLFTHAADGGIELWVGEVATAAVRRLTGPELNLAADLEPAWLADGRSIVYPAVRSDRGPEPAAERVPGGPVVQENLGAAVPARTYQDLLTNAHDEALFEHFLDAQLMRIDLDGSARPLGPAGAIWEFEPSPDGRYLLVETLHRPFSYLVPAWRFPRRIEVWNEAGEVVKELADLPLQEGVPIPFGSVPIGPRQVGWRSDAEATLHWAEALDGGDAGAEADERDRLFLLEAPFDGEPTVLATLPLRLNSVAWGDDDLAMVTEFWWKTRKVRTWRVRPGEPERPPEVVFDRSFEDRYADPGTPATRINGRGRPVLRRGDGPSILYLVGVGASPEGNRPFVDRFDLASGETERLFHSEPPFYEQPFAVLEGAEPPSILTLREAVDVEPNLFRRDLASGELVQLTSFPHPSPQLSGLRKEQIRYQRADGVQLNAMLYTPPGWKKEDGPLPTIVWAYPQEFKDADAAGQIKDSPYRFDRVGWWSPIIWLTQGYAVLDDPTLPIIGEGDAEPNDTYVEQLVASAAAAIDEVVRRGVTDRDRVAIGGHSYGAFMTANLLAHSDLFATGVAQSGAYNRTLTPFGFQAEERTFWQAPEVYFRMSPFMHVDKIDEPILLIHGEADNNSGTFPMQSERFFNALKGLGATARLVMLPYESHGYRAEESILHATWEKERWLERYLKNAEPRAAEGDAEATDAPAEAGDR